MGKPVPTLTLNSGGKVPALGFGTYSDDLVAGDTHKAVVFALESGYRHLDGAWFYRNEEEVGSGLREWLGKNPHVKREDIFVTTKVWPHLLEPEDVEWSLNNSLKSLGVDYVDCFLIHWPFACERTDDRQVKLADDGKYIIKKELTSNLQPTWRAMEKMAKSGKAKAIGVSNWNISKLKDMLKYAEITPAVNQIEIHPFFPHTELVNFCFSHKILPVAYSPLGKLGENVSSNKDLIAITEKKGVTMAQIMIAWGIKRGYAVIPKSFNEGRIRKNFEIIDLDEEEFDAVSRLADGGGKRFVSSQDEFGHNVWPEDEE